MYLKTQYIMSENYFYNFKPLIKYIYNCQKWKKKSELKKDPILV